MCQPLARRLTPASISWLAAVALSLACSTAAAANFNDGATHIIDTAINVDVRVFDADNGLPTTVITRDAAQIRGIGIYDHSLLQMYDSTSVYFTIVARDASRLEVSGGSAAAIDLVNDSQGLIAGGSFGERSNNAMRVVHQATARVSGGSFRAPSNAALVVDTATLEISGGTFIGRVQAADHATLTIRGGSFQSLSGGPGVIYSSYDAVTTIYGRDFNLAFGVVPRSYRGPLTGTLANGDPIDATLQWGGTNSSTGYILLAQAVPEPGTWALWLAGGAGLLWQRRRALSFRRQLVRQNG